MPTALCKKLINDFREGVLPGKRDNPQNMLRSRTQKSFYRHSDNRCQSRVEAISPCADNMRASSQDCVIFLLRIYRNDYRSVKRRVASSNKLTRAKLPFFCLPPGDTLLKHEKAVIINTTLFNEEAYHSLGLDEAMRRLIDDWALRYPGIQKVEHVYFYAVGAGGDATRQGYLQQAYRLGKEFEQAERMREAASCSSMRSVPLCVPQVMSTCDVMVILLHPSKFL